MRRAPEGPKSRGGPSPYHNQQVLLTDWRHSPGGQFTNIISNHPDGSRTTILGHREALAWAGQGRDLWSLPSVGGAAAGDVIEVDEGPALIQGGDAQHVQGKSVESDSYVGQEMLARGGPLVVENNPPADESSTCTGISFMDQMAVNNPSPHSAPKEFHDSASSDEMSDSNESKSDSEDRIISPHLTKNLPVKSVPSDPSKPRLPEHKVNNDLPIPTRGMGGTTQYQPSTDNDDTGSDLPLSNQGGGFISQYHTPQRTADELPTVEDSLILGRQDKSKQSMPHVHTSPDLLLPGVVYVPFPPSSGRRANTHYPCPGRMSECDQVQPIPGFDPKTKKQVLHTIWRPKTKSFQVILETIPRATPTQAKRKGQMSYCLDETVDIGGRHLHFASKTVLMCHVCHYQIIQQARVMAGYAIKELEGLLARSGPLVMENTLGDCNNSGEGRGNAPAQLAKDEVYTAFLSVQGVSQRRSWKPNPFLQPPGLVAAIPHGKS
jgi:hypothetical protein